MDRSGKCSIHATAPTATARPLATTRPVDCTRAVPSLPG
ncbi:MAG: hypothetical protein AVDCRST_MAG89-4051 [uncultured Gemmatimonadetes bacterium]|uniref:Uncharacterized protein n=1 Tax=uncultured Gemmatimonadota bacterium TaxID=203437 RepID=A0A6J4MPG2_9BACT|nr:MAG: hypothetical protein AVDCRST_MAG89-4051 [uncultured Gemmatimonadota bacterium]